MFSISTSCRRNSLYNHRTSWIHWDCEEKQIYRQGGRQNYLRYHRSISSWNTLKYEYGNDALSHLAPISPQDLWDTITLQILLNYILSNPTNLPLLFHSLLSSSSLYTSISLSLSTFTLSNTERFRILTTLNCSTSFLAYFFPWLFIFPHCLLSIPIIPHLSYHLFLIFPPTYIIIWCQVSPFTTVENALSIIKTLSEPKATHNCWALRTSNVPPYERSSDDGEPGGTAGRQILNALEGEGTNDTECTILNEQSGNWSMHVLLNLFIYSFIRFSFFDYVHSVVVSTFIFVHFFSWIFLNKIIYHILPVY